LSEAQVEGLVDYVRLLSLRGEVELRMAATFESDGEWEEDAAQAEHEAVWSRWQQAEGKVLAYEGAVPPSTPESIARGAQLYNDATKGNCSSCHGVDGRGDGPAAWKIDARGERVPAYLDAWGDPILPRNLRLGIWRGGDRPIDLWRRIANGSPGGPMPALRDTKDKDGVRVVTDEEIWSLVHYVRSLSQEGDS
jgi:mono/diheme cytochrome c family protein